MTGDEKKDVPDVIDQDVFGGKEAAPGVVGRKHDWAMGLHGPWKHCRRCGIIANRVVGGWAYKDGLKELGTVQPPCKGADE